jgi:putative FmdB family regulatory protein
MPTYDYLCDACDHKFELFQSITEDAKKKCPECGKSKLRRLFGTGAAIVFKGSGFYQTDYRSEAYKKSASKDKADSSSDSKPADGKAAESKPAESMSESKPKEDRSSKKGGRSKSKD